MPLSLACAIVNIHLFPRAAFHIALGACPLWDAVLTHYSCCQRARTEGNMVNWWWSHNSFFAPFSLFSRHSTECASFFSPTKVAMSNSEDSQSDRSEQSDGSSISSKNLSILALANN